MRSRWMSLLYRRADTSWFPSCNLISKNRKQVAQFTDRASYASRTVSNAPQERVPLRKELKDSTKVARLAQRELGASTSAAKLDLVPGWELTVGIEIHAQLNTARKLFSDALTDPSLEPNSRVAEFDLALPGSQPVFQYATLIPALRAALALGCSIQAESRFDRKHYFYHDQPSGYQITQYYYPFAKDGEIILDSTDGMPQGQEMVIGIKQVQLEQDTARTQDQDVDTSLVDFNRAGHPLIEIISLPHIHSPRDAAAYVKKVQALLFSVDAVTTGMELGGLRADVNVSVRRADGESQPSFSYGGVSGLGQRTEIKNLSSFKGVEDAIRAERDRQIAVLEAGGTVEGETRGWSISNPGKTRRLRGKEGDVDYRYMPDPDIPPLYIGRDLVEHIRATLPPVPTELALMLRSDYGLSDVDAWVMLSLDDGKRLIYFQDVVSQVERKLHSFLGPDIDSQHRDLGRMCANWVLHELGSLLTTNERTWTKGVVPVDQLADIINLIYRKKLTTTSAKQALKVVFEGDQRSVKDIVAAEGLTFNAMTDEEYEALTDQVLAEFPIHVKDIVENGKHGKINFLLGQMMRHASKGRVQAQVAEACLKQRLFLPQHTKDARPED